MPGFGFGYGGARRHRRPSGGTPTPTPTPTPSHTGSFTLTAIAAHEATRIHQRSTTSGGGQGKGQGAIPLAISAASAGTIGARILSDDMVTVLQTLPDITLVDGQTSIALDGVDARLGWFHIELQGADGVWQRTSQKMGMGALYGFAGQSLTARLFGRQDGQADSYASLGITPNANAAVLASYKEGNAYMPTVATMPWQTPGDVGDGNGPNATGVGEFLNRMIALTGVNCGAIGHSQGGVSINSFYYGQGNWTRLADTIARAGGAFEGFVWGQGHSDSAYGLPPRAYADALDVVFGQLDAANSVTGYGKYVWTIPAYASSGAVWGTPYQANQVRKGGQDWCDANEATYVHMYDFAQVDNIHETQAGSRDMGRHIYRAMRAQYGASSGLGPKLLSATRSGATITITLSDVGQSTLNLVGTPGNRIYVFPKGRFNRANAPANNRFPVSAISVTDATTLSLTLADDPGDGHALDLWLYWAGWPGDGTVDNLYDDRIDDDGLATGRILQANFAPVRIAAPSPGGTVNAPPGGFIDNASPFDMVETGTSYETSAGGGDFGQQMKAGTALAANGRTPYFAPITIEGFFTCPAISETQVLFGGFGPNAAQYVGIDAAGKIKAGSGSVHGATTLVAGKRYHVAYVAGPGGRAVYLTNITDGGAGVRDAFLAGASSMPPGAGRFALRNLNGGFAVSGGAVDEWAVFNAERYSGASYICPTGPFDGTEANIVALYRCDEDAREEMAA